jgi:TetR/AcrR family transcriptional repressor of nem operon
MPWEKSFNEETALEKAMQVFWEKGFEPASIADLLEGTGLNRGSLYNAFGGKQQLFVK